MADYNAVVYPQQDIWGHSFRCSVRTANHIDDTKDALAREHPGARLLIVQGCNNTGVGASAGTHDFDAVFDFIILGIGWWDAQDFLRRQGWACWYRHTGSWARTGLWHIHSISLGFATKVGIYVDGGLSQHGRVVASSQVDDYYRHSLGLKGQHNSGLDHSWFPSNIKATIYTKKDWFDMASKADLEEVLRSVIKDYLGDVVTVPKSHPDGNPKNLRVTAKTALWILLKGQVRILKGQKVK